jgi:fumarylacetoacetase
MVQSQTGDLFGTGTCPAPSPTKPARCYELTAGGKKPITLSNGENRAFLQDGDTVILRAFCQRDGFRRVGFGECRGTVLPARGNPRPRAERFGWTGPTATIRRGG